jgi:hypothetical protein
VTVNQGSSCGDGNEATVSFHNTSLTNVTVSVDSQVSGGTASDIECTDVDGNEYNACTGAHESFIEESLSAFAERQRRSIRRTADSLSETLSLRRMPAM